MSTPIDRNLTDLMERGFTGSVLINFSAGRIMRPLKITEHVEPAGPVIQQSDLDEVLRPG